MRWWCALLLGSMLAGCADAPSAPQGETVPDVVSDPTDFAGSAAGSHIHDYWGGAQRLALLDQEDGCAACTVSYGGDHGVTIGHFRPEPDHVVPPGTAWIHVQATWSVEDGDYQDVALYVKTANMTSAEFVTVLESGVPVTFNSTNADNDPPHHRLSLWEFEIRGRSATGDGASASNFQSRMVVHVERGLPIPVFPPHPDHWNGASELLLHESTREVRNQFETPAMSFCSGCLGRHAPQDGAIVPPTATEVEVVLEVEDGLPGTMDLMVHGADTWEFELVSAHEEDPQRTRLVWHLPVEGRPDSPYAKQSLWDLYLVNDQPAPAKYWQGTYSVTVKAIR